MLLRSKMDNAYKVNQTQIQFFNCRTLLETAKILIHALYFWCAKASATATATAAACLNLLCNYYFGNFYDFLVLWAKFP